MSVDPTAIPMHRDPRVQRFVGIAYHGDTPFDVPYMSQIDDTLWVGGCADGLLLPRHIEHVISLYPWETYRQRSPKHVLTTLEVVMYDSAEGDIDASQVWELAQWVNNRCDEGPTLVHCQAGLNRSPLIAAAALIQRGMPADEAIAHLREKRSPAVLCNPMFESWLMDG